MTPEIYHWAARHGVSMQALHELQQLFGMLGGHVLPAQVTGTSEQAVQSAVRLEAARKGVYLWRNNVGALIDARGVPVRYGLANDSKQVNEVLKSGDLIGCKPRLIRQQDVGHVIGQFVSREVKKPDWRYTGTPRERAQLNWAMLVVGAGGDASFVTGEGTL